MGKWIRPPTVATAVVIVAIAVMCLCVTIASAAVVVTEKVAATAPINSGVPAATMTIEGQDCVSNQATKAAMSGTASQPPTTMIEMAMPPIATGQPSSTNSTGIAAAPDIDMAAATDLLSSTTSQEAAPEQASEQQGNIQFISAQATARPMAPLRL